MNRSHPDTADGDVLQSIADQGSDMSSPMCIDFHVDAPDEQTADQCLRRIARKGFTAEKSQNDDGRWTITIPVIMRPNHDEIVDFQMTLDEDLAQFGAKSDGWGSYGNVPENLPEGLRRELYP